MAETQDLKNKNQAFLQQMDRQRLNRPCNRVIDLRGKVSGECQAYQFGDKTHYLDDRGYLLARQLLDRFDGRYTIGVYEALLKALKNLSSEETSAPVKTAKKSILYRDSNHLQLIPFDSLLKRKEARILYNTSVLISVADVLYHATTVDITTSAIRLTSKRTFTLNKGDIVTVKFTDFCHQAHTELLENVHYSVIKIDHDEQHTYLILARNPHENIAITTWFDEWTERHNTPEYLDLDTELFNLASHYYQRCYSQTINSPLLWIDTNDHADPVKAFHLSSTSKQVMSIIQDQQGNIDFSLIPFNDLIKQPCMFLILVSQQEDHSKKGYAVPYDDPQLIALLLANYGQQETSRLLLARSRPIAIATDDFSQQLNQLPDRDYAAKLAKKLESVNMLLSVTDITASCSNLPLHSSSDLIAIESYIISNIWQGNMPNPAPIRYHIQRNSQRFNIRTSISLELNNKKYELTTSNVSDKGLAVTIPDHIDLSVGDSLKINFIRWQKMAKHIALSNIPYVIKSSQFWSGRTRLGLEREVRLCPASVNSFFPKTIELNKASLIKNDLDTIHSIESHIFGSLLTTNVKRIPLYLAMDANKKRIFQAVTTSNNNDAEKNMDLWHKLHSLIVPISDALKTLTNYSSDTLNFGIYCYKDEGQHAEWHITSDLSFSTINEKSLLISRALHSGNYYFYHCSIASISSSFIQEQADLNTQLLALRHHSTHKVKHIRETIKSLLAVCSLTDITDIIKASYQR